MNQAVYEIMLANNRAYIELVEINVKRAEIEPLVQSAINIMPCLDRGQHVGRIGKDQDRSVPPQLGTDIRRIFLVPPTAAHA